MASFLEKLSKEDQDKVKLWVDRAKSPAHETDIPPELYIIAEHGFYFGFEAVKTALAGFYEAITEDGKKVIRPYTLEMVVGLNQAVRKVRYNHREERK